VDAGRSRRAVSEGNARSYPAQDQENPGLSGHGLGHSSTDQLHPHMGVASHPGNLAGGLGLDATEPVLSLSDGLGYLPGANAGRAHVGFYRSPILENLDPLKVGLPPPLGVLVGVTDRVPGRYALLAYLTATCHLSKLPSARSYSSTRNAHWQPSRCFPRPILPARWAQDLARPSAGLHLWILVTYSVATRRVREPDVPPRADYGAGSAFHASFVPNLHPLFSRGSQRYTPDG